MLMLMSAVETGQMSAADTRQTSTIATGRCPDLILYICLVSTADICPVSAADVLGGDENDFDPFFTPKMFKMEFIRRCPAVPGVA